MSRNALAEEAGLDFVGVQSGKLRRASRLSGYLNLQNFLDIFRVPVGIVQSLAQVWRFRPHVVLSTGGYVSVPPTIAAALLGVPVLTHEQTVQIGLANRIAARFATRIALTFEGAQDELPPRLRAKAFVTGNPVREAIFGGDKARAVSRFGFSPEDNALPAIYVTGGAQGACPESGRRGVPAGTAAAYAHRPPVRQTARRQRAGLRPADRRRRPTALRNCAAAIFSPSSSMKK